MEQSSSSQPLLKDNDEIDLLELWRIIWRGKWQILCITAIFAVGSVIYALSLPDVYRTEVLLLPVEDGRNNSALMNQLGGLASLAGFDLNSGASASQKVRGLAILQSRAFIRDFFDTHELTVPFMAMRPTRQSGVVEIDPNLYDENNRRWVREVAPPLQPEPSAWEVYRDFSEILTVQDDPLTGLVIVSLEWYDPIAIKNWLEWLIDDLNNEMRAIDVEEARKGINYLNDQLTRTQLIDMRNVFYRLIEQQTQTIMLADAREDYAFRIIDPPVVPEEKNSPRRSIICIVITFIGGVFSIFFVLLSSIISRTKQLATAE